jgi:hypothetical protein
MGKLAAAGWMPASGMKMKFDPVGATDKFNEAVKTIASHGLGARLIHEIEARDKNLVEIWPAGASVESTCQVEASLAEACCYQEVLSDAALCSKLKELLDAKGADGAKTYERALKKFTSLTKAQCIWKKEEGWSVPQPAMDALTRGKIAYYLREHLTPGPGAPKVTVLWNIMTEDLGLKDAVWSKRPAWLSLAHELIHAWRWTTGQAVFDPREKEGKAYNGYHEEAMTVGLPPYDGGEFTENRFRNLGALAPRGWYGPTTQGKSEAAIKKHGFAAL